MTATAAWKASVLALVVFCLLASGSLVKQARAQEDGWVRSTNLAVARSIDRVSNFVSLNRPLDFANELLGRPDTEPRIEFPPTTLVGPAPDVTTTTVAPPEISPDRPLEMMLYGDSQGINLGEGIRNATAEDPLMSADFDGRVSTGLARPDYYNWPARIVEDVDGRDVDTVLLHFGANDNQALLDVDGNLVAQRDSPEWEAEYRRRVAGLMDVLRSDPRRIVWIGNPVMREAGLSARGELINRIVTEEAATRPWVTYVDTADLLDGPNHEYVDYFTPPGGEAVRCRAGDGVHLTSSCVDLVVEQVLAAVRPMYPVATTTTVPPTTAAPADDEGADAR